MAMLLPRSLLVLACCSALFAFGAKAAPATISETGVISFLEQFGYLSSQPANVARARTKEGLAKAISALQSFAGLNVTGIADEETTRLLKTPRCGLKDKAEPNAEVRSKRYAFLGGQRWNQQTVTYRVTEYSRKLNSRAIDQVIAKAFAMWEEQVPLKFRPSSSGQADIIIRFARLDHGDGNAFDGPGGVLAHAYAPAPGIGGDVHFDEDEDWTIGSGYGTDFFQTAVHEIGHALGLDHSNIQSSIMYPYQRPAGFNVKLYNDDIAGIRTLYGGRNGWNGNGWSRGPRRG